MNRQLTVPDDLVRVAADWVTQDPDPGSADALADLVRRAEQGSADAIAELTDAFTGRLEFGTAGLRGALGP